MKAKSLNRIVGKWRRSRERHKKLEPVATPISRPAELREGTPPTKENA